MSEFPSLKAAAGAEVWPLRDPQNRLVHGKEVAVCDIKVGIVEIPAILKGHILLRPQGAGYLQAHAKDRALWRMRSMTEAS